MEKKVINNTNANTSKVVSTTPTKKEIKFSAKEQAKAEMEKKQALEQSMKTLNVTTTKKEEPMKVINTNTSKAGVNVIPATEETTKTIVVKEDKPKVSRAIVPSANEEQHYGLVIGDKASFVTNKGVTQMGQVLEQRILADNGRSATKVLLFDENGVITTKKTEVYTTRLTKVAEAPKVVAEPKKVVKKVVAKTA
ncbi:MAG: hypothetical protein WCJ62_07430 [Flavobacterium sp.]